VRAEVEHESKRVGEGIETYLTASSARLPPRLSGNKKKLVEISPAVTLDAVRMVNWAIPVAYYVSIHHIAKIRAEGWKQRKNKVGADQLSRHFATEIKGREKEEEELKPHVLETYQAGPDSSALDNPPHRTRLGGRWLLRETFGQKKPIVYSSIIPGV
jgi:hypothetical protein